MCEMYIVGGSLYQTQKLFSICVRNFNIGYSGFINGLTPFINIVKVIFNCLFESVAENQFIKKSTNQIIAP